MNRMKAFTATVFLSLTLVSCASYNAYQKAKTAETQKDWDVAVVEYEKALDVDPGNRSYKLGLDRAKRESSRAHFEKGKSLTAAAHDAKGLEQLRLAQMAMGELQLTVRLDPTNQFAAVELTKIVTLINDIQKAAQEQTTLDDVKKRARAAISKAQPPQLNPASNDPISLTFSRDTPVKDIYRALGNAFGINILFDQAVKDDRITIELRDVTAQQALERVMQAANHFYKVLDEKTIIVIPDNPQARRDYEDLVIQTFYLSNGDAEQVTNVVRTMIEARNVFPLKALNAITIRDTADKVRIAEKIIEANDKAKAEVVVQVELVEMNLTNLREMGFAITGIKNGAVTPLTLDASGNPVIVDSKTVPFAGGTLADLARSLGDVNALRSGISVAIPAATYSLLKTLGNTEVLANPELRISEGEKATLHIGDRIPVPVTTFTSFTNGTNNNNNGTPYTSFQYQDVGIKVAIEPRVHHNREVTLKLTVEVSSQGNPVKFAGQEQPTFSTRTIESTIRLMDGETNFLAGLIQSTKVTGSTKTPVLGDLPFIGRLFTNASKDERRTDLVLTMTPHIVRIPDITEEDVAPMWVGTGNNLTFRGVSPRIESQGVSGDPFTPARSDDQYNPNAGLPLSDGEPGNYILPEGSSTDQQQQNSNPPPVGSGSAPIDPFKNPPQPQPQPQPPNEQGNPPSSQSSSLSTTSNKFAATSNSAAATDDAADTAALRLAPRIAPQPSSIALKPGETRVWDVVGMDLDGLTTDELSFRFNPHAINVTEVTLGNALVVDPSTPPVVSIDREAGSIKVKSTDGKPLAFVSGGEVLAIHVQGGLTGETFLVVENPTLKTRNGNAVMANIAGGRARID